MNKVFMVGGGIGSMASCCYLIRDAGYKGSDITIFEELDVAGGSLDGCRVKDQDGFLVRGGRMLNEPTFECLQGLLNDIPSLTQKGKSVWQEIHEFNEVYKTYAVSRLIDKNGARVDVSTMGFSWKDRMQFLTFLSKSEKEIGDTKISDWFSPEFFTTNFWYMWQTTFAFQLWSSAIELQRYCNRFLHEFVRIETLEGIARTPYNQYDCIIKPIQHYLMEKGVKMQFAQKVTDIQFEEIDGKITAKKLEILDKKTNKTYFQEINAKDLLFYQNGSMTDSATIGNWKEAAKLQIKDSSFPMWQKIADRHPGYFGNPRKFYENQIETTWYSFTVTLKNKELFRQFTRLQDHRPGPGALMTFKDSNWLMSIVIFAQPHFIGQKEDEYVFWGYGLYPNKVGNYVNKCMQDCTGEELFYELCQHCRISQQYVSGVVNVIPCIMPYIVSMFQPRTVEDRPKVVPKGATNFALVSQFVEVPRDVVFTVEFSTRAAQMAVYELCNIKKPIPPVSRYDRLPSMKLKAVKKALKCGKGPAAYPKKKSCCCCKIALLGLAGIGIGLLLKKLGK